MVSPPQVSENAKQDLKDGLALYNSETNLGLRNAWNIIQAEVGAAGVGPDKQALVRSPFEGLSACTDASNALCVVDSGSAAA